MNKSAPWVLVLSALLGNTVMASPLIGHFASNDARLEIRADGFRLDLACAQAEMAGTPRLDPLGNFKTTGTFEMATGGPQYVDETGAGHPARFAGKLVGDHLTLTIMPASGDPLVLNLNRNRQVKLVRCL